MNQFFGGGGGDSDPADEESLLSSFKKTINDLNPIRPKPEPQGLLSEFRETISTDWGLTWSQRLTGFAACFGLGLLCSLLSTLFMLQPTKFGITYSFGNLLSLSSTAFLVGPGRQIRNMFRSHRAIATLIFLGMLGLTLFSALKLHNTMLTLVCIILQMCAFTWYCLSYIPYARQILKRCFGSCLGEDDF